MPLSSKPGHLSAEKNRTARLGTSSLTKLMDGFFSSKKINLELKAGSSVEANRSG